MHAASPGHALQDGRQVKVGEVVQLRPLVGEALGRIVKLQCLWSEPMSSGSEGMFANAVRFERPEVGTGSSRAMCSQLHIGIKWPSEPFSTASLYDMMDGTGRKFPPLSWICCCFCRTQPLPFGTIPESCMPPDSQKSA